MSTPSPFSQAFGTNEWTAYDIRQGFLELASHIAFLTSPQTDDAEYEQKMGEIRRRQEFLNRRPNTPEQVKRIACDSLKKQCQEMELKNAYLKMLIKVIEADIAERDTRIAELQFVISTLENTQL